MRVEIYAGLTTVLRPYNDLLTNVTMGPYTTHLGGLYGTFEMFLPCDPTINPQWNGRDRVVIRDGLDVVWEGVIASLNRVSGETAGITVSCVGAKSLLARLAIDRRWADNRLGDDAWRPITTSPGSAKFRDDRQNRIRFTPDNEQFEAADNYTAVYTMPTGRTIARIAATSTLSETAVWSPNEVRNEALTVLANACDGDATTSDAITINTGQYIYIGSRREFDSVTFDFGATVNGNTATISGSYVQAQSHTWQALASLSDGTAAGGKTFAQDGRITFTKPTDWAVDGLVGSRMFWIRLTPSANLTANIVINELTVGERQAWELRLRDTVGGASIFSRTADGSGAHNEDLLTPRQALALQLISRAKQAGIGNGTLYGEVTGLTVYDKTTGPTVASILIDLITEAAAILNTDAGQITANTYAVVPFMTEGPEAISDILDRAVAFSDSSQNVWAWALMASETAATPDGKPVLKAGPLPALTDYDYVVNVKEIEPPFELALDYFSIVNYVTLSYRDAATGLDVVLTPADEAALTDADSVALYGRMEPDTPIRLPETSAAAALNFGKAYLARYKTPRYLVSGPIRVKGSIRTKSAGPVDAARIDADNKRLKIENYIDDVAGVDGAGLTFLVTGTSYDPATRICEISTGVNYDDLALMLSRMR
jgi:hypothetical protein